MREGEDGEEFVFVCEWVLECALCWCACKGGEERGRDIGSTLCKNGGREDGRGGMGGIGGRVLELVKLLL